VPPVHVQCSGDDTIQLTQNVDEAGECNSDRTKSCKNLLNLFQPIRIESNPFAVTENDAATEHAANDVSDFVAENGAKRLEREDNRDRYDAVVVDPRLELIYGLGEIHDKNPLPPGDVPWESRNPLLPRGAKAPLGRERKPTV
jgi:hypothetical protein